jgi:uncharacterized membrane-anchored protein YjiN (DUF445 family)
VLAADRQRLAGLRRMKAIAGGALLIAACLYIASVIGGAHGGWPFLKATSEAAMVGGLADWFAVTALFRHPLGMPIPHTAIIPRKKDQIGASLGDFVQQNFLTIEVLGPRLEAADVPRRAGDWLTAPGRAEQLAGELAAALTGLDTMLADEDIRLALAGFADTQLRRLPAAPVVAKILDLAVQGNQHQILLTHALHGLGRFLDDNRDLLRARLSSESPEWVPEWVDARLFNRLFTGLQGFLAEVANDDEHAFRVQFDARLRDYSQRLRTDPAAAAALENWKVELLDHPAVRAALGSLWTPLKQAVLQAASDPDSEIRRATASMIRQAGQSLSEDPALRGKVQGWLLALTRTMLNRYSSELSGVITQTVARWDTDDTSRRIELQIGRDLQFIRVNGTVVGALVGLLIYSATRLF